VSNYIQVFKEYHDVNTFLLLFYEIKLSKRVTEHEALSTISHRCVMKESIAV
jgi:hypothetical protein